MNEVRWRKSSYSSGEPTGSCIELAHDLGTVRDSKNPDGPVLKVDARPLLAHIRNTS